MTDRKAQYRQSKAKERQAKRDAGLVKVEVWVERKNVPAIKSYAERLNNGTLVWLPDHAGNFVSGTITILGT